jgi:hypothetical protein
VAPIPTTHQLANDFVILRSAATKDLQLLFGIARRDYF